MKPGAAQCRFVNLRRRVYRLADGASARGRPWWSSRSSRQSPAGGRFEMWWSARCGHVQRRGCVTSSPGAFLPLWRLGNGRPGVTGPDHGRIIRWPGCADHRCERRHRAGPGAPAGCWRGSAGARLQHQRKGRPSTGGGDHLGGRHGARDRRRPAQPGGPSQLGPATAEALGPGDVLVSNAGLGHVQPLEDITAGQFDEMLAVNLRAPFLLARAVPYMRERGFGRILFISSVARSPAASSARITRRPRPAVRTAAAPPGEPRPPAAPTSRRQRAR